MRLTAPALYFITVSDNQTLDNGTKITHTDTIAVMAEDRTAFDTKLKGKWDEMKAGLANQNVPAALNYFAEGSKDKYEQIFTSLSTQLPSIVSNMQDIELIYLKGRLAKYRINRVHNINGQNVTITYFIYFIKDKDGLWRIENW